MGQELLKIILAPACPGLRRRSGRPDSAPEKIEEVVLFDIQGAFAPIEKTWPCTDPQVKCITGSIEDLATMKKVIDTPGMSVFHLAGIMSGQAEKEFDLCWRVNIEGTRNVLEASRALAPAEGGRLVRVVFTSSLATFGESKECPLGDFTKQVPMNTYGMSKIVGEMLVNDYTRKGFIDGCTARLPTVIVRPGKPNAGSTSCYSGVIREPLSGLEAVLPLDRNLRHSVSSTRALVANLKALHDADMGAPGQGLVDRAIMLPSRSITLQILIDALYRVVPAEQHSKLGKITDKFDPFLSAVVHSMKCEELYHQRAIEFGLCEAPTIEDTIREYVEDFGVQGGVVVTLTSESNSSAEKRARTQ